MDIFSKMSLDNAAQTAENAESPDIDPAGYMFIATKYHDWLITVGDPGSEKSPPEKIGVASSYLLSQSSFFRKMVANNKPVDTKNIVLTTVSPAVFKLVLTFLYGGELPEIDCATAEELALTADVYKIAPLVKKACELLIPTGVQQLFPALRTVVSINSSTLEPHVTKIVQEDTKELFKCEEFLDLDYKCLDFIARQEQLSVTEVELWRELVKWAQHKASSCPSMTLREHLQSTLQYVRLASLSQDEVIKEVMPLNIITTSEIVQVLEAIISKKPVEAPELCKLLDSRKMYEYKELPVPSVKKLECFKSDSSFQDTKGRYHCHDKLERKSHQTMSYFQVKALTDIEVQDVVFKSLSLSQAGNVTHYSVTCNMTITKLEGGVGKVTHTVQFSNVVFVDNNISFSMKLNNGQNLKLEKYGDYFFSFKFLSSHPVYDSYSKQSKTELTSSLERVTDHMIVKLSSPCHLLQINYEV